MFFVAMLDCIKNFLSHFRQILNIYLFHFKYECTLQL